MQYTTQSLTKISKVNVTNRVTRCPGKPSTLELRSILFDGYENLKATEVTSTSKEAKSFNVLTSLGACSTFRMFKKSIFKEKWMDDAYGLEFNTENENNWNSNVENYANNDSDSFSMHIWTVQAINISTENICNNQDGINIFKVIVHQPNEIATVYHPSEVVEYGKRNILDVTFTSERSSEIFEFLILTSENVTSKAKES